MNDPNYDPTRLQLGNRAELNLPDHAIRERDYLCREIMSAKRFRSSVCYGLMAVGMLFQMLGFTSVKDNTFTGYFSIVLGGLMMIAGVILFVKKTSEIGKFEKQLETAN
ncbi:hypothetical protein [Rubellicoccus peritrichatus]|uniref:Uncharacterized protein n=1 Tax=Rubellicoccus peritrichatus TaxID=3080537 RepID=A0AAQ3LBV6_9BACT|nr:hypothetical protein [Puniceicoccus sp. CR14]WOO39274.1 hypothetical protein RZN69_11680 [Puniceicoccus sp. CR14]